MLGAVAGVLVFKNAVNEHDAFSSPGNKEGGAGEKKSTELCDDISVFVSPPFFRFRLMYKSQSNRFWKERGKKPNKPVGIQPSDGQM